MREEDSLKAQLEVVTRDLEALKARDGRAYTAARVDQACFVCGGIDHLVQECPTFLEMKGVYEAQCNAVGMYQKPYPTHSETYNPGWRNHPNLSWKSNSNQPPSSNNQWRAEQFHTPQYHAPPPKRSLEETLQAFMQGQTQIIKILRIPSKK